MAKTERFLIPIKWADDIAPGCIYPLKGIMDENGIRAPQVHIDMGFKGYTLLLGPGKDPVEYAEKIRTALAGHPIGETEEIIRAVIEGE